MWSLPMTFRTAPRFPCPADAAVTGTDGAPAPAVRAPQASASSLAMRLSYILMNSGRLWWATS